MTAGSVNAVSFFDSHRQHELEVTPYLSEDLQKNWQLMWSNHVVNPEQRFVETAAYLEARRRLWYTGWVTLCGDVGDGKSCIGEHLLCSFVRGPLKYPENVNFSPDQTRLKQERHKYRVIGINEAQRECYTPLIITSPEEYKQKVDHSKNQIVFIDDIFGKAAFDWSLMEGWRPLLEDMLWNISIARPRTLVIVCVNKSHLERVPGEVTQLEWFREGVMMDLADEFKPNNEERVDLLNCSRQQMLPKAEIDKSGHNKATRSVGLVYRMFNQVRAFSMEGKQFFTNPWQMCTKSIEEVCLFDKTLYFTLCVAVLHDGKLDLSHASLKQCNLRSIRIMLELASAQGLPNDIDLAKLRFAARLLAGFFFKPVQKWVFEFTHPKIFYICAAVLCKSHMDKVIELASRSFIMNHLRAMEPNESRENELVIRLEPAFHLSLGKRFTAEILNSHLTAIIQNESCENEVFVKVWFENMKQTTGQIETIFSIKDKVLNRSIVYWACYYGHGALLKTILGIAKEINLFSDESVRNELIWGLQAACGSTARSAPLTVSCLINHGVYVNLTENYQADNAADVFGREMCMLMKLEAAPIHTAAFKGHPEVVQLLLDNGANINEKTPDGFIPLHRAAMRRDRFAAEVVRVLIKNKSEIDVKSIYNETPLDKAVSCGHADSALALIEAGAEYNEQYGRIKTLLGMAVLNRQYALAEFLMKQPVKEGIPTQYSPLPNAVYNKDIKMINLLIDNGTDMNAMCENKIPALHTACSYGDIEIVKLLIEKGANINGDGKNRLSPLHYAAKAGMYEICELLLSHGAKTEAQSWDMETPLVMAARGGHQMVVWLLLREGMKLGVDEVVDRNGPID